jgi:hypothetical protein
MITNSKNKAMTHPLILAFGSTYEKDFPLILIVGREPNNETVSDKSFGYYDFRMFPRCAFWNLSFKLFGSFNGLTTTEIKQEFVSRNTSPIIFTDASSKGVLNKVTSKHKVRNSLTEEDFNNQVDSIFANEKLAIRIKLIILSGLSSNIYQDFKVRLNHEALKRQIPTKEILFLFGTNYPKIEKELSDNEIDLMKSVFENYMTVD